MIVVDTNLVAYLFIQGQRTDQAEAVLLKDTNWAAPLLWRSEFRNILIGLVRKHVVEIEKAAQIMEEAESMLSEMEFSVTSANVLYLAKESGCSAYDCEFVSLAKDLDARLVTSDRQVLKAFPAIATSPESFVA